MILVNSFFVEFILKKLLLLIKFYLEYIVKERRKIFVAPYFQMILTKKNE
jgi:hypothetical protein